MKRLSTLICLLVCVQCTAQSATSEKEAAYIRRLSADHAGALAFISQVFRAHGIPDSMRNLAIIESHLDNNATSTAGARGPWQFMPEEARFYGLQLYPVDERTDLYKSTFAAARFLKDLYRRYNDWTLVLAAYNGGSGRVDKAIAGTGTRQTETILAAMPPETQEHVRRFGRVMRITMPDQADTLVPRTATAIVHAPAMDMPEYHGNLRSIPIVAGYDMELLLKELEIDTAAFRKLNPDLEKDLAEKGKAKLTLPAAKMEQFMALQEALLEHSLNKNNPSTD